MDLFELIKKRRSVFPKQYNKEPILKEELDKILSSANWAPTHKKTEPWRFKVVQGGAKLKLADFLADKNAEAEAKPSAFKRKKIVSKFEESHTVIAICMQRSPNGQPPEWEEISAVAIAVQNIWLACTELHIGAYWSSPSYKDLVSDFFNLKEGESCLGFFYMGKYDGEPEEGERKTPIEAKVEYYL
ncbi:nitroreductase family protein [Psychroflexus sediminis]|uniref:Putative NAD(P)H nitroreductase n=1 Tax=Psychroflexus sediminis TaxID=470826 RepID=A0A1G7VUS1_9FLAO|nr:nitroreductase [Psychroflexus sediminis]SDG63562.1 Nitroreductase [Psychroflexus sediminis]